MQISKRLKEISDLIDLNNSGVFDVGSDHGYLLLLLLSKGYKGELMGVENKIGPFNNLKKNTFGTKIDVKLSDGLDELTDKYSCIVLAGMGYLNIQNILKRNINKINGIKQIVVDAHNFIPELRRFIVSLGFFIDKEIILKENDIFYELISFKKGINNYTDLELNYGPILLKEKNEVFIEKYSTLNKKLNLILEGLPKDSNRYKRIEDEIKMNESVIF